MSRCQVVTRTGTQCKNGINCLVHSQMGPECSICLMHTNKTRATKTLICGHVFHRRCITQWCINDGATCPMCRRIINPSKYKISINIENLETNVASLMMLSEVSVMALFGGFNTQEFPTNTEIQFQMANDGDLQSLLRDLHISLTDVNPLVFDAE